MDASLRIKLPEGQDRDRIDELLGDKYTYKVEESPSERWCFYDTFDWRLFNKSLTLHLSDSELFLRRLPDGEYLHSVTFTTSPAFAWNLPESSLRERLGSIINPRALLKLVEVFVQSRTYCILNTDRKTVARLVYTEVNYSPEGAVPLLAAYLSLRPVRGYPKYARQIGGLLKGVGDFTSIWEDNYTSALEAVGKESGDYSGKVNVQLEPGMRSDGATKVILRQLLEVMKANEAGIRDDIDTEFLHDYRVAIRRTRSALSQIRGVFPENITHRFKEDFAYLGKHTNELRDLDVYLLSEHAYRAMLPVALRDDISPLFDYLRAQREQALEDVISGLDSERSELILSDWEDFLNEPLSETPIAVNATMPIIDLARKRIFKRYRKIIKDGNYLLDHPQDKLLHALRIECKKLRYLIEFFSSLFPPKKVLQLIGQLKKLQDNLGDFNDLSVQQAYLLNIAEELPLSDIQSKRALLATGSLVETLASRQQVVRNAFAKTFTKFASPSNQEIYRKLFANKGRGNGA